MTHLCNNKRFAWNH